MSLLPTTRINSLVTASNGGAGGEPGIPGVQDEDILLVDFQPVVVPNSQILSSPSTNVSTAMYPIAPPVPVAQLPGAHLVGMNHHPSVSSDGVTTPISASSGKVNNPNHYSLVNLSNHVHNNNTSREDSDFNYPTHQIHRTLQNNTTTSTVLQSDEAPYDEDDEFARHKALAQPSYMSNKRRSRRFISRDSHNQIWDNVNANHVGFHHQQSIQQQNSSSMSSSEDSSDTGFLMGTRKTAYTRKSVQKVVDPHPSHPVGGGNGSPSASTGLLPNLGNRKRVRRKRPSARNRKPRNNQRDKMPNPSDVLSFCCCLCQDDPQRGHRTSTANTIRSRYLRLTCFIVVIIVLAVLTSITLSLQRKVDSIDVSMKKLDQAVGSPLSLDSANGANGLKPTESLQAIIAAHNDLNSTVVKFKAQLDQVSSKLQELEAKVNAAVSKPDGVAEVKGALAKLGSRVQDLTSTIEDVQLRLKTQAKTSSSSSSDGSAGEPQSTNKST